MNSLPKLFVGIFLTFLFAWTGLVALPYLQLGGLQPQKDPDSSETSPPIALGLATDGAKVYAASGCVYCHSQQVRPEWQGSDIERGWGLRRTVPRDYVGEKPTYLGTMRTGPDLSNIGRRQPNVEWHLKHLYDPKEMSKGSIMPSFRYLFHVRKIEGQRSKESIEMAGEHAAPEGYEIVPSHEAQALVAYLLSLDRSYSLKEAPVD